MGHFNQFAVLEEGLVGLLVGAGLELVGLLAGLGTGTVLLAALLEFLET